MRLTITWDREAAANRVPPGGRKELFTRVERVLATRDGARLRFTHHDISEDFWMGNIEDFMVDEDSR